MKPSTQRLLDELRQTPEYEAERVALELIGRCELRRSQLGWSYAELARRMGVSRTYISKLMSGTQNSTLGSLVKLARTLDCEITLTLNARPPSPQNGKLPAARRKVQLRVITTATPVHASRARETHPVVVAAKPPGGKPETRS